MKLVNKVLDNMQESAAQGTIKSAVTGLNRMLDDFESALQGSNGLKDPAHPKQKEIIEMLEDIRKIIAKIGAQSDNFKIWFSNTQLSLK